MNRSNMTVFRCMDTDISDVAVVSFMKLDISDVVMVRRMYTNKSIY